MQKAVTYDEHGETFFIIIKGVCQVQIPNPTIKDWKSRHKDYQTLLSWKESHFDHKIEEAKRITYERYLELKREQKDANDKTKTKKNMATAFGGEDNRHFHDHAGAGGEYNEQYVRSDKEKLKQEMR